MGFCDAALGEDKVLLVYYLWYGKPYTATLADRVRSLTGKPISLLYVDKQVF